MSHRHRPGRPHSARLVALTAAMLSAAVVEAAPRPFASSWTSQTLEAGRHDFEAWLSPRIARFDDAWVLTETRAGLATGLTPAVEALWAVDLAFTSDKASTVIDPRLTTVWRWAPLKADGLIGAGGLARGSIGFDSAELELRLFADKRLGKLWLALNAAASRSFFWSGRTGVDTHLLESGGIRYAVGENASFGFEGEVRSGFERGAYRGTAVYVGPSFTFRVGAVFVSLGALAQVAADKAPEDRGDGQPLELRDNERFLGRLVLGYVE